MDNCQYIESNVLKCITENCQMLTTFSIASCVNLKSSDFESIANLKKLEKLNLYRTLIDQNSLIKIIESCKNIKCLNLGSCDKINNFDAIMMHIAENNCFIESLDLWRSYSLTNKGLQKIANNCKNMKELDIGWWFVLDFILYLGNSIDIYCVNIPTILTHK